MTPRGFIQDKLEIKFLILYIAARVIEPVPFDTMLDLTLCDDAVDYFDFSECLADLVKTGHLTLDQGTGFYAITEKGRRNSEICENSLPYSVRMHCDENLVKVNEALRREAQVQSKILENEDGTNTLHLQLNDVGSPLLVLDLLVPGPTQAIAMSQRFQADPAGLYHAIVALLSQPGPGEQEEKQ